MAIETAGERPQPYPVEFDVEPQYADRNRVTVAFRIILAIPHLILVGGPGFASAFGLGFLGNGSDWSGGGFGGGWIGFSGSGALGAAAGAMAVIAWFAIIFANTHPRGLWDFAHFYMRWRTRAVAYMLLLRDDYPPFGDEPYPVRYEVEHLEPDAPRDRWSVGLRVIYAIPHIIVLIFLSIAAFVVSVIAWFAILFTGAYPEGMYGFVVGVTRWSVRVESYLLLMRDEYPPFSLD